MADFMSDDLALASELMAHERECKVRWESVERRLHRLEVIIWCSNGAVISGLFALLLKLM